MVGCSVPWIPRSLTGYVIVRVASKSESELVQLRRLLDFGVLWCKTVGRKSDQVLISCFGR